MEGQSTVEDTTYGSVDSFTIRAILYRSFYCATTGYTIRLWVTTASGWKDTGQRGYKEAKGNPTWTGKAILYNPSHDSIQGFTVEGTWNTRADGDYFDYDPETPTYSAHWILSGSSPLGITEGKGGSKGELLDW